MMPSRTMTTLIVVFWLATTGWLLYREIVPRFRAGEPPPYTIDLTDEVGASQVSWVVLQKGELIGSGISQVTRKDDRTFVFDANFKLDHLKLLAIELKKLKILGAYRVTEEGKLLDASANVKFDFGLPIEVDFKGKVQERKMSPTLQVLVDGKDINPFPLEPFAVSESGNVMNPMHLVHKIAGLRVGQSWKIPLMDPLRVVPDMARNLVPGKEMVLDHVLAEVKAEPVEWHGSSVDCFKIEYRKPGEKILAATWVRRRDAVVLQQWASYEGIEYTLQRVQE